MDMKKYAAARFIKCDDVRDGPIQDEIAVIKEGKFDKPDVVFESGDILSLNATNTNILVRAYGPNSKDWIGKTIERYLGEIKYQGKMQESVLVKPISPPLKPAEQTKLEETKPAGGGDFNDELPSFAR